MKYLLCCILFSLIDCLSSQLPQPLPQASMSSSERSQLAAWRPAVRLLFCGSSGAAHVFFERPPVSDTGQQLLLQLAVRLRSVTSTGHEILHRKTVKNPSSLTPVDALSGLVHVAINDPAFSCTSSCRGYTAELIDMTRRDTYYCSECQSSGTKPGCLYYPNGTAQSAFPADSGKHENCTQSPELMRRLAAQFNCSYGAAFAATAGKTATDVVGRVSVSVFAGAAAGAFVAVCAAAAIAVVVLAWRLAARRARSRRTVSAAAAAAAAGSDRYGALRNSFCQLFVRSQEADEEEGRRPEEATDEEAARSCLLRQPPELERLV